MTKTFKIIEKKHNDFLLHQQKSDGSFGVVMRFSTYEGAKNHANKFGSLEVKKPTLKGTKSKTKEK